MFISGEDIADVICAVEGISAVQGVHALPPSTDPDAFAVVIALSPYSVNDMVKAHYAVIEATGGRALAGRVLYIDADTRTRALGIPVELTPAERETARARIEDRRILFQVDTLLDRQAIEAPFRELVGRASNDHAAVAVSFGAVPILEIVADPFPSPPRKMRVLVIDHDPSTATRISALAGIEVIEVDEVWAAVDRLTKGDVDLAVCALKIGETSGAKIHKLVAAERPEMARRIVYLASEAAVSSAPPSSASGRVIARPVDPGAVKSFLETLGPVA